MIHIERVTLESIKEKIEQVSEVHHEEVETSGWKRDPDYASYQVLEDDGMLIIHALLDDNELVGYSVDIFVKSLHYRGKVMAFNDMVYINPAYRGLGFHQYLIKEVLKSIETTQSASHTVNLKVGNDCSHTMKSNGYIQSEVVWHKVLEV